MRLHLTRTNASDQGSHLGHSWSRSRWTLCGNLLTTEPQCSRGDALVARQVTQRSSASGRPGCGWDRARSPRTPNNSGFNLQATGDNPVSPAAPPARTKSHHRITLSVSRQIVPLELVLCGLDGSMQAVHTYRLLDAYRCASSTTHPPRPHPSTSHHHHHRHQV